MSLGRIVRSIVVILFAVVAPADAFTFKKLPYWDLQGDKDGCSIDTTYDRGATMSIEYRKDKKIAVYIMSNEYGIPSDTQKPYEISFIKSGKVVLRFPNQPGRGTGSVETKGVYFVFDNITVLDDFANSSHFVFEPDDDGPFALALTGSEVAIPALISCMLENR